MFPPHISLVTSQSLDRSIHLTLCVDYKLWVLDRPPGVIYISHGLPRKKVGSRNFLRWAPIYIVQESRWHTAASRNLKANLRLSQQQRILRMLRCRNSMRWDGRFASCDPPDVHIDSEIAWKLAERHSNKNRLRCGHLERGSNPGSIFSFSDPSSVPERGHQRCIEDYSTMWSSFNNSAPWRLQDDWSDYSLGSIGCWTKIQRAAS